MNYSHVTARRRVFACASLVMALDGCSALSAPAPESPVIYHEVGHAWTTRKRQLHLYECVNSTMVCSAPASYLNVTYHCRCE
jgi:hypothetical protein